jgi:hypothetical protein
MNRRGLIALALGCGALVPQLAFALSVPELQQLLKADVRAQVSFREIRESPWLAAPVVTQGTMRSTANALEKKVDSPVSETWRLMDDRVERRAADGQTQSISFQRAPALGALSETLRSIVAGDLAGLARDFDIRLEGDAHAWHAILAPRAAAVRQQLQSIEVQGAGGTVHTLIVIDREGEKTTTIFEGASMPPSR